LAKERLDVVRRPFVVDVVLPVDRLDDLVDGAGAVDELPDPRRGVVERKDRFQIGGV
jgi:hypothetical protein